MSGVQGGGTKNDSTWAGEPFRSISLFFCPNKSVVKCWLLLETPPKEATFVSVGDVFHFRISRQIVVKGLYDIE